MTTTKSFSKRIIQFFRPFWKYFIITALLYVVIQALAAFTPYLFGKGVDAIAKGDIQLTFQFLIFSLLITILQQQIIWYIKEYIDIKYLDVNIDRSLSVISLRRMFQFSIGQHINEHSGVKQTIVNKGQNALDGLVNNFIYIMLQNGIQIIVTVIILAIFDWRVAGVATAFIMAHILISNRRNHTYFPKIDEVRKKNQAQSKLASELYRNSTLVIAESQEDKTVEEFNASYTKVTDFTIKIWLKYIKAYYTQKLNLIFGRYLTLGLGVYFILIGNHSAGMFVALFAWTGAIFDNLNQIMNMQRSTMFQVVEIKKYFDLLDIIPDINPNTGGTTIDNLSGKIEFNQVSFAYPYRQSAQEIENEVVNEEKDEHTISNVSFTIPAGAKVGFVGVSGSGKSTIVNLMRRYYDATQGSVLIDGTPLTELDLHWLRSQIGNVEQKIDLFDRSIRDNILFGLPVATEVSEERLQKAVEDASLTDFVAKLKDHGLDTVIGEGGIKVSGGERQRIGIARALIKDPKILIFDEATSALDSINEKLIHEAINRSAEGRTTIIIAHRLSTVMDADIIFVVAEGKIVGQGTHAELEKKNKEYQKLIKNQILMG
ncbi:MAG: ABC transporter ATP-binding protein [Candidatus Pacebacteria bacterium]|jgi:ABC-type multidrug transport system fused ATPase/permease subunit|nr:ABC transporter ATP-binding protein [Candidatus Paceibacterota bacterium]MBP9821758.1 ABC transporter ATP-binding protein [Candidatus Paceibacterota bacterium]